MSSTCVENLRVLVDTSRRAVAEEPPSPKTTPLATPPLPPPQRTSILNELRHLLTDFSTEKSDASTTTTTTPTTTTTNENIPPTEKNDTTSTPPVNPLLTALATQLTHITDTLHTQATEFQNAALASSTAFDTQLADLRTQLESTDTKLTAATLQCTTQDTLNHTLNLQLEALQHTCNQHVQNMSTHQSNTTTAHEEQSEQVRHNELQILALTTELARQTTLQNTTETNYHSSQTEVKTLTAAMVALQAKSDLDREQGEHAREQQTTTYERQLQEEQHTRESIQTEKDQMEIKLNHALDQVSNHTLSSHSQDAQLKELTAQLRHAQEQHGNSEQGRINAVRIQTEVRTKLSHTERELNQAIGALDVQQKEAATLRQQNERALTASTVSMARMGEELKTAIRRAETSELKERTTQQELLELHDNTTTAIRTQAACVDQVQKWKQKWEEATAAVKVAEQATSGVQAAHSTLRGEMDAVNAVLLKEREESSLQFSILSEECRTAVQAREAASKTATEAQQEARLFEQQLGAAQTTAKQREELLLVREKELKAAVAKLSKALDACEGEMTCMHCLRLFVEPSTLVASGDTYCTACIETGKAEDVGGEEERCHVKRLDTLSGKFGFMKQALDQLKNKCVDNV